jgi:hypothetical protein
VEVTEDHAPQKGTQETEGEDAGVADAGDDCRRTRQLERKSQPQIQRIDKIRNNLKLSFKISFNLCRKKFKLFRKPKEVFEGDVLEVTDEEHQLVQQPLFLFVRKTLNRLARTVFGEFLLSRD